MYSLCDLESGLLPTDRLTERALVWCLDNDVDHDDETDAVRQYLFAKERVIPGPDRADD